MKLFGWILTALLCLGIVFVWQFNGYQDDELTHTHRSRMQQTRASIQSHIDRAEMKIDALERSLAGLDAEADEQVAPSPQLMQKQAELAQLRKDVETARQHLARVDFYWREVQRLRQ